MESPGRCQNHSGVVFALGRPLSDDAIEVFGVFTDECSIFRCGVSEKLFVGQLRQAWVFGRRYDVSFCESGAGRATTIWRPCSRPPSGKDQCRNCARSRSSWMGLVHPRWRRELGRRAYRLVTGQVWPGFAVDYAEETGEDLVTSTIANGALCVPRALEMAIGTWKISSPAWKEIEKSSGPSVRGDHRPWSISSLPRRHRPLARGSRTLPLFQRRASAWTSALLAHVSRHCRSSGKGSEPVGLTSSGPAEDCRCLSQITASAKWDIYSLTPTN